MTALPATLADVDWSGSTVVVHTDTVSSPRPVLSLTQTRHRAQCPCGWTLITHRDPSPEARAHAATHDGDVAHMEWRGGEIVAQWADGDPSQGHTFGNLDACPACPEKGTTWSRTIRGRHIDLMADGRLASIPEDEPEPDLDLDLFTSTGVAL